MSPLWSNATETRRPRYVRLSLQSRTLSCGAPNGARGQKLTSGEHRCALWCTTSLQFGRGPGGPNPTTGLMVILIYIKGELARRGDNHTHLKLRRAESWRASLA